MSGGPTKIEFLGHRDVPTPSPPPRSLTTWRFQPLRRHADVTVAAGEAWTKVIGPFMIYVNSGTDSQAIYKDARAQAAKEQAKWPFDWVKGIDYPTPDQRLLRDRQRPACSHRSKLMPNAENVQRHSRPYRPRLPSSPRRGGRVPADAPSIGSRMRNIMNSGSRGQDDGQPSPSPNVRPGKYTVHAFADGVLGEFAKTDITVRNRQAAGFGQNRLDARAQGQGRCSSGMSALPIAPPRNSSRATSSGPQASSALPIRHPLPQRHHLLTIGKSDTSPKTGSSQQVPHALPARDGARRVSSRARGRGFGTTTRRPGP